MDIDAADLKAAFVTGSHAYGTPGPDSDIDLAVFCAFKPGSPEHQRLCDLADATDGSRWDSLQFGKLDLLLFFDAAEFAAWRRGTEELKARRPVSREEAVDVLERCKADSAKGASCGS